MLINTIEPEEMGLPEKVPIVANQALEGTAMALQNRPVH
jgi:hypothetical protein